MNADPCGSGSTSLPFKRLIVFSPFFPRKNPRTLNIFLSLLLLWVPNCFAGFGLSGLSQSCVSLDAGPLRHQDVDLPDGGACVPALSRGCPPEAGQARRAAQAHLHHQGSQQKLSSHSEKSRVWYLVLYNLRRNSKSKEQLDESRKVKIGILRRVLQKKIVC